MSAVEHETLEAALLRLKEERDAADRRYNEALTTLDRALVRATDFPHPPPGYDEHQITPLNQAWDIGVTPPATSGLKGKLAAFVWRIVGPPLQQQKTFNSLLVDHLNRNVAAHRESQRAIASIVALLQEQHDDLLSFNSRLLTFLQQITPYVDTTGRRSGGQALVVNGALNGLAGDLAKRWESLIAREQRFEARVAQIGAAHEELRALVGISQQAAMAAKREIERLASTSNSATPNSQSTPNSHSTPNSQSPKANSQSPKPKAQSLTSQFDAYKYVGFENE